MTCRWSECARCDTLSHNVVCAQGESVREKVSCEVYLSTYFLSCSFAACLWEVHSASALLQPVNMLHCQKFPVVVSVCQDGLITSNTVCIGKMTRRGHSAFAGNCRDSNVLCSASGIRLLPSRLFYLNNEDNEKNGTATKESENTFDADGVVCNNCRCNG